MRIPLPKGLEDAWTNTGKAGRVGVLALLVGGVVAWTYLGADPVPPTQAPLVAPAPLPDLKTKKAQTAGEWLTIQEKNVELEKQQRTSTQTIATLEQRFVALERDQKTKELQREQQADAKLKQALDSQAAQIAAMLKDAQTKSTTQDKKVLTPRPATTGQTTHQAPAPPAAKPVGTLALDVNQHKDWPGGGATLPDATRADTAYLPAGSFATVRLVTGVFATSRKGGALPVLFSVTRSFNGPQHLHGPGSRPTPTEIPIEGCLALGKAEADLSSSRANMTADLLSCVWPEKDAYEKPLKGYVVGNDGTLGLPCKFETRDTAYLARTFLVSLMSGAAEAFALSKRTVITTPFGGTMSTVDGSVGALAGFSALNRATADLSKFYLEQAERLTPVLWCEADTSAKLVLQEGVALEGFPTQIVVSHERSRP